MIHLDNYLSDNHIEFDGKAFGLLKYHHDSYYVLKLVRLDILDCDYKTNFHDYYRHVYNKSYETTNRKGVVLCVFSSFIFILKIHDFSCGNTRKNQFLRN